MYPLIWRKRIRFLIGSETDFVSDLEPIGSGLLWGRTRYIFLKIWFRYLCIFGEPYPVNISQGLKPLKKQKSWIAWDNLAFKIWRAWKFVNTHLKKTCFLLYVQMNFNCCSGCRHWPGCVWRRRPSSWWTWPPWSAPWGSDSTGLGIRSPDDIQYNPSCDVLKYCQAVCQYIMDTQYLSVKTCRGRDCDKCCRKYYFNRCKKPNQYNP